MGYESLFSVQEKGLLYRMYSEWRRHLRRLPRTLEPATFQPQTPEDVTGLASEPLCLIFVMHNARIYQSCLGRFRIRQLNRPDRVLIDKLSRVCRDQTNYKRTLRNSHYVGAPSSATASGIFAQARAFESGIGHITGA